MKTKVTNHYTGASIVNIKNNFQTLELQDLITICKLNPSQEYGLSLL